MNRRRRKLGAGVLVVVLMMLLFPPASILVTSWYRRYEASSLLTRAKNLHPGIASEPETRKVLAEFDGYITHGQERVGNKPAASRDSYWISNYPNWVDNLAPHLPMWMNERIWFLPRSSFSVSPRFENGQLALLEFREIQDQRGNIHPFAATVRVLSTSNEQDVPELPRGFTGFHVAPIEQAAFSDDDKQVGPSWIVRVYVTLDERASSEQFARAFDFQLSCLTSLYGCDDARKLLPVAITTPSVFQH
jgi:hypothetical protein